MDFRLVDAGWDKLLDKALREDHSSIRVICPFIKERTARRLLARGRPSLLQVITRFDLMGFYQGVSDIEALRLLLDSGAVIRGVRNLHAKLYFLGSGRVVLTSANLTEAALLRNLEFGFVAEDKGVIGQCRRYFDGLWERAGGDLSMARLDTWAGKVASRLALGAYARRPAGLGDEGVEVGTASEVTVEAGWVSEAEQGFVKFFGESDDRSSRSTAVCEEIQRGGSHWACAYPREKRPRSVDNGAIMFMGRMVSDPSDILVYGRAVGMRYVPGRDDASPEDIRVRSWKAKWPHYIRVHHPEFVAGSLSNGVSLNELMSTLKSDSFASTQRNAAKGSGNVDPRRAYRQQAQVELTIQGMTWLNERLEQAYAAHGKLAPAVLDKLDRPTFPGT